MSRSAALRDLAAALRGEPPHEADWLQVLELANAALITPRLHSAMRRAGALDRLPNEVRDFTAEVWTRNAERNRRLFEQLGEAVRALNGAGIEPVLLKGAALWAVQGRPADFDRMLNDLDLLVAPAQTGRAVQALRASGFGLANAYPGPEVHVVAELGRPSDVGYIDLHQRPPGPPGLAELDHLARDAQVFEWAGGRARAPSAAAQIFFLVLHDQFHDGDYWRGGLTLRHLFDIAELARGDVDWSGLRAMARTRLTANALEVQLQAAHRLAKAPIPAEWLRRPWSRLQHARQAAQFRWPGLAGPLAVAAALSEAPNLIAHRRADRADRRRLFGSAAARPPRLAERVGRVRDILTGTAAGKV